jgi:signal transduction histidine kinase
MQHKMNIYQPLATQKHLQLSYQEKGYVPDIIMTDPLRLRQILANLIGNAIKFTQKGSIHISCNMEAETRLIKFSIEDTGIGIDEHQLQDIFNPFSQADNSSTRQYGGTGLGLTICRQLVHMLGGELYVHSKLGEGSRFWFTLPYQEPTSSISV